MTSNFILLFLVILTILYCIRFVIIKIIPRNAKNLVISYKAEKILIKISKTFNLDYIDVDSVDRPAVYGNIKGHSIFISVIKENNKYFHKILIKTKSSAPYKLEIRKMSLNPQMKHTDDIITEKQDINVEDNTLCKNIDIYGSDETSIIGLLNYDIRMYLYFIERNSIDFSFKGNQIYLKIAVDKSDELIIKKIIKEFIKTISHFSSKNNTFHMLLYNTKLDPIPSVRKNNLHQLFSYFKDKKQTKELIKKSINDESLEVSVYAAEISGLDIYDHIINIIKTAEQSKKEMAIQYLREHKLVKSVSFLRAYFKQTNLSYIKIEIIKTLQEFGDSKLNKLLIDQLKGSFSEITKVAVEALASCGKKNAIAPLHKIIQDSSVPDYIKSKAEYAISQIRSRIDDTGEGWLSVTEPSPAEGALSLKENTTEGGLGIADTEIPKAEVDNE